MSGAAAAATQGDQGGQTGQGGTSGAAGAGDTLLGGASQGNAGGAGASGASGATGDAGGAAAGSGSGAGGATWRDTLPEDIRNEPSLKVITDIGNLAKSYVNAQKMIGAEKIPVPGKSASDEDWKNVYRKLGQPESIDKYEIPKIEGADAAITDGFKKIAFENGILPKQAAKVVEWFQGASGEQAKSAQAAQKADIQKGVDGLKQEWGQGFDKELSYAKAALDAFGDPATREFLNKTGMGNNPVLIKMLNKMGKTLSEDQLKGSVEGRQFGLTDGEIQGQIDKAMADPAYYDGNHINHKKAVTEVERLYKMRYPEQ